MKFCKACGQPVEWHPTVTGKQMLIDPDPHPEGRFGFNGRMQLASMPPGTNRRMYRCHWDTCPKGAQPLQPGACGHDDCTRTDGHRHCYKCGSTEHLANACDA